MLVSEQRLMDQKRVVISNTRLTQAEINRIKQEVADELSLQENQQTNQNNEDKKVTLDNQQE